MSPNYPPSFRSGCLSGRVGLITGGGSGICREELELANPTIRCFPVAADVRDFAAMSRAIDDIMNEFGRIDVLVNGAAGNFLCPASHLSYKGFKAVMEIDAGGTFIASKLVREKAFIKQSPLPDAYPPNFKGIIINISMTLHYVGALHQVHAGAAKAAIDSFTKHLAVEWGPEGIRVVGVAPGPIVGTEGFSRLISSQAGTGDLFRMDGLVPLQRLGTPRDVANICTFLTLPESNFITGETIVVDGGQWLTSGNYSLFSETIRNQWASGNKQSRL